MVAFTSVEETSIRKQATNSKFEYLVQHVPHYKQIKEKTQGVHQQGILSWKHSRKYTEATKKGK